MNQKERMLANLPYKAWLDGLSEERSENAKRIYEYNNLPLRNWKRLKSLEMLHSGHLTASCMQRQTGGKRLLLPELEK